MGGTHPGEGRVEVYGHLYNIRGYQYATVCDIGWTVADATVVCTSLGYHSGYVYYTILGEFMIPFRVRVFDLLNIN
jgi:hypothetical protein